MQCSILRWRLLHLSITEERELGEKAAEEILEQCLANDVDRRTRVQVALDVHQARAVLASDHPLTREVVRIVESLNRELPQLLDDYLKR